jgi:hypothetical protein
MKRFVVLCSVVALISLYLPTSWATAPAISDLPDARLQAGSASGTGLGSQALDAYNVEDFIKDFDDDVSALTITLPAGDITMIDPPPTQADNAGIGSEPTIELDGSRNVDVYGRSAAGWARYTVYADDGTNPATNRTAVAKYSTFAMNTPSLTEGRFYNLSASGWQLSYAWMGEDIVVPDLDSTITPPTTVNWEVYMNDISYDYDANGNLLGINPGYIAHGTSVSAEGWNVAISSTGGIVLSTGASLSPGPFLIGVLAINPSDADDIDATRIMVSAGMLALSTPGGHGAATHDKSETLDGLTPGPVTITPEGGDSRIPIQDGSHWAAVAFGEERVFDVGTLDIVDLSVDGPPAGAPGGNVASGNALKVSFDPTTWTNPEAVRLYSRPFTDIQAGEVYTFAANIATDITDVTNAPNILMAMSSPLGAKAMGYQLSRLQFGPSDPEYVATGGTVLDAYQQDIVPLASDGWQTVSVNYSPPLTPAWLDLNGDNNFDQADLDLIADIFGNPTSAAYAGWTDELATAHCALRVSAHEDATSPFAVWIDNLRVYRSAYELDLGLEKTAYSAVADLTGVVPTAIISQPGSALDGSFEGSTVLDDVGLVLDNGSGNIPEFQRAAAGGPWPDDATYGDASAGSFSVISGPDHTKSGGSSQCLQLQLTGTPGGTDVTMRAWASSAVVLLPGSGIYCMESYMTMSGGQNEVSTNRTPRYTIALNQMAPNCLASSYGAVLGYGGTASSIADDGWDRIVGTAYLSDRQAISGKEAVMARVILQANGAFGQPFSDYTSAKAYIDDLRIVQVDDPAKFFDADLFDSI